MTGRLNREEPIAKPSPLLVSALIAVFILAVYLPVLKNELLGWDDDFTIIKNPFFSRLSAGDAFIFLTRFYRYDYYPVFYLSLAFDRLFWGTNPFGYHLGNVLLHAANAWLIFWFVFRLGKRRDDALRWAALTALLFAAHPVNVEAVAWATGRKILLAAFFSLLSLHGYVKAEAHSSGRNRWIFFSVIFFALGCLSNVCAVATPLLLVAYDAVIGQKKVWRSAGRKWGFWLVGLLAIILKLLGRRGQPELPRFILWFSPEWVYTMVTTYGRNILSLLLPFRLSARYPAVVTSSPLQAGFILGTSLFLLALAGIRRLRKSPIIVFGILWFLIALLPVSQFIRHHIFRADRFLYFPGIGLFFLLSLGLASLKREQKVRRGQEALLFACFLLLFLGETGLTELRISAWRNDLTLWGDALRKDPRNAIAHNNLGVTLVNLGRVDEGIAHYREALELRPRIAETHRNMGAALVRQGDPDGAIAYYRAALRLQPGFAEVHYSLARILSSQKKWPEAINHYREAARLRPEAAEYHGGLGEALEKIGSSDLSIRHYRRALQLQPDLAETHNNLGQALARQGSFEEAIQHFQQAIEKKPAYREAYSNLGAAFLELGELKEAERNFEKALELEPDSPGTYNNLGNLFFRQGRFREAVACYRKSLELKPDFYEAATNLSVGLIKAGRHNEALRLLRARLRAEPGDLRAAADLARLLATCPEEELRDAPEAVKLAEMVCRETGYRDPLALETLAAAQAEAGQLEEAVRLAERARELARAQGNSVLAGELENRLSDYRAR